jgi:uncharacterized membrane protein
MIALAILAVLVAILAVAIMWLALYMPRQATTIRAASDQQDALPQRTMLILLRSASRPTAPITTSLPTT